MVFDFPSLPQLQLPIRRRKRNTKDCSHYCRDGDCEAIDSRGQCHQSQISAFLYHLPPELRCMIYHYVLMDHVFHLSRLPIDRKQGLGFIPYQRGPKPIPTRFIVGDHPLFPKPLDGPEPPATRANQTMIERYRERRTMWALLLTCRQVHDEAIGIFFNVTTLRFENPNVLFDLRAQYIRQQHFLAIKKLEIISRCNFNLMFHGAKYGVCVDHGRRNWDRLWRLIAEEMRLLSLTVWIVFSVGPRLLVHESPFIFSFLELRERGIPLYKTYFEKSHSPQDSSGYHWSDLGSSQDLELLASVYQ